MIAKKDSKEMTINEIVSFEERGLLESRVCGREKEVNSTLAGDLKTMTL